MIFKDLGTVSRWDLGYVGGLIISCKMVFLRIFASFAYKSDEMDCEA